MDFQLAPLLPEDAAEVYTAWGKSHPLHPLELPMLRERLFAAAIFDKELSICARGAAGQLLGIALGTYPLLKPEKMGALRWLGVVTEALTGGVAEALADEMSKRLFELGAEAVRIHASPPFYVRPGIDIREPALIARLLRAGWVHEATHFNLTCDLNAWRAPEGALVLGTDAGGYCVRRGEAGDEAPLAAFIRGHFTEGWALETALAFAHEPMTVFVAERGGAIVGFAAYEVSQCVGAFGPTGVDAAHRKANLGRRLLWACLDDLKTRGRSVCEIGWVGPVPFYYDACGAVIGPTYWCLRRER